MTALTISRAEAMRHCRDVTRRRARNFYYGLKLLPEPQRSALYAVYAWMRQADDLADDSKQDACGARQAIAEFRRLTDAALAGRAVGEDPVLVGLAAAAARFPLQPGQFHAMLDGQLDDLSDRQIITFDDLREYCYRVASTVGQICIEIWGYVGEEAPGLAADRGVAFQLTNILRDFAEDHDAGRTYLPAEDFARHEISPQDLRGWSRPERARAFLTEQLARAESFYDRSDPLDELITPTCQPTLWAMTSIYRGLLDRMKQDPAQVVLGPRVRLSAMQKGAIAIRAKWNAHGAKVSRR